MRPEGIRFPPAFSLTPPACLRSCPCRHRKALRKCRPKKCEQNWSRCWRTAYFVTLEAQRESAECYIKSQEAEGWVCLQEHYDDGGYTGGNMVRPALKRLLSDIEAGKVDCVAVYQVDRLSRSLMDFAKILEVFERKQVAFVSVTQQFNTTNSMGRLMLNALLSFVQFEREIISERTRDRMGGHTTDNLTLGR